MVGFICMFWQMTTKQGNKLAQNKLHRDLVAWTLSSTCYWSYSVICKNKNQVNGSLRQHNMEKTSCNKMVHSHGLQCLISLIVL